MSVEPCAVVALLSHLHSPLWRGVVAEVSCSAHERVAGTSPLVPLTWSCCPEFRCTSITSRWMWKALEKSC